MINSKLGVNVDHVATLRQARGISFPSPIDAALLSAESGADSIVAHLREDRRHIQDSDVIALKKKLKIKFNMEISIDPSVLKTVYEVRPDSVTIVPEKRLERTTESGVDTIKFADELEKVILALKAQNIAVSLFVDPIKDVIVRSREIGADDIEIHTGAYANAGSDVLREDEAKRVEDAVGFAVGQGLNVHVGHGLDYDNVSRIARIDSIIEFNIGFAIIARSVFYGIKESVSRMKRLIQGSDT